MAYIRGVQSITDYLPKNLNQNHEKLCAYIRKIRPAEILEVDFSIGFLDFMLGDLLLGLPRSFYLLYRKKKERNYFTSS